MFQLPEKSKEILDRVWTEETDFLVNLFRKNDFEIRIAGGAVRDILMGITPADVDFATDATPPEMKQMFTENNIRMVNMNGESHGTITARINDKENFEITTLRFDKVTDGRRAEVVFTKDWKIDSERRDLTINSMFLDKDGQVYDYFNGYEDINTRTIRFVGNPEKRIQEDYLRILRYFRFYGRISSDPDNHLSETIEKIRENREPIKSLSGERVWSELKKIISGKFAPDLMKKMEECEILPFIGLPEHLDWSELTSRFGILVKNQSNPAVFLSTILVNQAELDVAFKRLKLSNDELLLSEFLITNRGFLATLFKPENIEDSVQLLRYFQDKFVMHIGDPPINKLKMCFHEVFKYFDRLDLWEKFEAWKPPRFPVRGDEVRTKWDIKGKKLGRALMFLKQRWQESNYTCSKDELVESELLRIEFMKCDLD